MSAGLLGLFDDVAALSKLAAASVDDVSAAAAKASMKTAGVIVDDTAVTPAYVHGLEADRELPIIRRIAFGSLRNKLFFILPAALLLSAVAPIAVEVILMFGGLYLAYEGAHKIAEYWGHRKSDHGPDLVPSVVAGPEHEKQTVRSAIRTDFILSAEIMVIALKEVLDQALLPRAAILVVVAVLVTIAVYGAVALIVRVDDLGLLLTARTSARAQRVGRALVAGVPKLLAWLSAIGTAAMCWVAGHLLIMGADELGWHAPYVILHHAEELAHGLPGHEVFGWLINTAISAFVGLGVGLLLITGSTLVNRKQRDPHTQEVPQ